MFRRIELIYQRGAVPFVPFNEDTWPCEQARWPSDWKKTGINSLGSLLNQYGVSAPADIRTHKGIRFYFTEAGWKQAGRLILQTIKREGWEHRVRSIKEKSVDVVYSDKLQVAIRPRRRVDE
jgi:hypothetical protein